MKSMLFAIIAVLTVNSASAKTEFIGLHSHIQIPGSAEIILKLADGRTAFWNTNEITNVTPAELDSHKGAVQIELNDDQEVLSLNLVDGFFGDDSRPTIPGPISSLNNEPYKPSILANYKTAQDILNSFNTDTIDGAQCYDKAHRWVYDESSAFQTKLMKAFLFFSDSYITRYHYKWWFHTAPFAYLRMNNETTERIMDPTFSQYPLKFKLWTDIFMENKVECKSITKYSQYINDLKTDCFIHRTTMYFWQPKDLDAVERNPVSEKTAFVPWEVKWAYEHGFGIVRP